MKYTLVITSWADRTRGAQTGATHYYGRIRPGDIDLQHVVQRNDPDYYDYSLACAMAKPGETMRTIRFIDRQQVLEAARLWMEENAEVGDTLEVM